MSSKTYSQFTSDLESSRDAVFAVAKHIQGAGRDVILPFHRVTPNENERYAFQDECDIKVAVPHQVKQSSRDFGSVNEFGFRMITVDERYKIEKQKASPPFAYWIVNKSKTGAIFIPWSTKASWDVFTAQDNLQGGRECEFLRCPSDLCRFITFTESRL